MIASLRGQVISKGLTHVIVEAQGVGYGVAVSIATAETLPETGEIFLHIHTALRENALELYGFMTQEEKALFEMLITVAGIGPRTSMLILSGISPGDLKEAIIEGDLRQLTAIPGIGKKSAERIILELKEKISKLNVGGNGTGGRSVSSSLEEDLASSLINLGYTERMAVTAAKKVLSENVTVLSLSEAVKLALKQVSK